MVAVGWGAMRVLISGSTGLVGTAVLGALEREGHAVSRLLRPESDRRTPPPPHARPAAANVRWNPVAGEFDAAAAEGADAVVHLAGASIAGARWNDARKRILRSSRVEATRHLVGALGMLARPPRVFVSASAIGYYGDRGDEELTEQSAPGDDFIASMAMLRWGLILSSRGGALQRMLMP